MSRIGKQPVGIPDKVQVDVSGTRVTVKGPRAELTMDHHPDVTVKVADGEVVVERPSDTAQHKALHGLTRSLIANMVEGVTDGYTRALEIQGVGYRAEKTGKGIRLSVGYSHDIHYDAPGGITLNVPSPTQVVVEGADKQLVGQVAAEIRGFRPPEPYKGKGIRYEGEQVRRKAGKTASA